MRADPPLGPPPAASIVIATCRLGGLDVTWEMLRSQTCQDFELVLVDYWWEERKALVAARWTELGLPADRLVHVPPRLGRWAGHHDSGQAYNTGFALARAPLTCLGEDYWLAHPRYVEQHLDVFFRTDGRVSLSGHNRRVQMPPLRRFNTPLDCLWSAFHRPFRRADLEGLKTVALGMKWAASHARTEGWPWGGQELFMVLPEHHHGTCNEAHPTAVLYQVNGFDEGYVGGAGNADADLGIRLFTTGHPLAVSPACGVAADMDHIAFPAALSAVPYTDATGEHNRLRFEERVRLANAHCLPAAADNNGFRISAPTTVADVIASYNGHRP